MKGKDKVAEKSLRKALEENPTFYLSRQQLALMLVKQGKVEEAKEQWELARNSCPGCFEATENLARYYQSKGNLKTALGLILDYKKIEGINPAEAKRALQLEAELNDQRSKIVKEASESKTRY
jgi:tetratricopeptide (TPR) repeat protein